MQLEIEGKILKVVGNTNFWISECGKLGCLIETPINKVLYPIKQYQYNHGIPNLTIKTYALVELAWGNRKLYLESHIKTCSMCGLTFPLTKFHKHKSPLSGVYSNCKSCGSISVNKSEKIETGVINRIYSTEKAASRRRGHEAPTYSKEELTVWLYANGFKVLYDAWVASGMLKDMKPSVDRLDDTKGYSLDNIQLLTWGENNQKGYDTKTNIIGYSLTKDGPIVETFKGYLPANRKFNMNSRHRVTTDVPCKNGYYWRIL